MFYDAPDGNPVDIQAVPIGSVVYVKLFGKFVKMIIAVRANGQAQ